MAHAMTPDDALAALRELPRYEERLAARTGGLTFMMWGLAVAGIFLTYSAAGDWLVRNRAEWAFALLWVPWVAAGSALTALLWTSHAVTLRQPPEAAPGLRLSLAVTALFVVLAGAVFVAVDRFAGAAWTAHSLMLTASGLCAAILGAWQRRTWGPAARTLLAAGAAMALGGVVLGAAGVHEEAAGLLAAAIAGTSWMAAGAVAYRMG